MYNKIPKSPLRAKGWYGMNNFLTEWGKDLKSIPVGPLGIIAMSGCEEMGQKVDA